MIREKPDAGSGGGEDKNDGHRYQNGLAAAASRGRYGSGGCGNAWFDVRRFGSRRGDGHLARRGEGGRGVATKTRFDLPQAPQQIGADVVRDFGSQRQSLIGGLQTKEIFGDWLAN